MPKIKTKRSATKKFKMSATGKAMRTQGGNCLLYTSDAADESLPV